MHHVYVVSAFGVMCTDVEVQWVKSFLIAVLSAALRWCAFIDKFMVELDGDRGLLT